MAWDFETDPEYQEELDWVADFVRDEIEPLGFLIKHGYDMNDPVRNALIKPLQEKVKARGLWACHLGPELGGPAWFSVVHEASAHPRATVRPRSPISASPRSSSDDPEHRSP